MISRQTSWPFVVFGVGLAAALTVFVSAAWAALYARYPWSGYEKAAAAGLVPHEFASSPRALLHAAVTFAVGGALVGFLTSLASFRPALVSWLSLWGGLLVAFALSAAARQSNLAIFAVVLFPVYTVPFLIAAFLAWAIRKKLHGSAG